LDNWKDQGTRGKDKGERQRDKEYWNTGRMGNETKLETPSGLGWSIKEQWNNGRMVRHKAEDNEKERFGWLTINSISKRSNIQGDLAYLQKQEKNEVSSVFATPFQLASGQRV